MCELENIMMERKRGWIEIIFEGEINLVEITIENI